MTMLNSYHQRLPDPQPHTKATITLLKNITSVRVLIQCLAAIVTLDYYHLYIGPFG